MKIKQEVLPVIGSSTLTVATTKAIPTQFAPIVERRGKIDALVKSEKKIHG